ncbi:MAG: 23S rRNA (adenine(2030)-N(6))-methyltransferase RlmJ [Beijerinckiaceae bacterium]|nr:23S rRNA (adenine(2030)-N(6))-methyltransferase RlmJ [Beijerinckiaceae bacterium]
MNYRHAFHAGNFADVMKHALLSRIILHLNAKETPYRYIDTHAGIGVYDLEADEALRTGEWQRGIGILEAMPMPEDSLFTPYLDCVKGLREGDRKLYPGSPEIVRQMARQQDRLVLAELHQDDFWRLRANLGTDQRIRTLEMDGWTVLKANVPPPERRGLVLIDPPFEQADEWSTIVAAVAGAYRKWTTGIFAIWYPIKDIEKTGAFAARMQALALPKTLRLELMIDDGRDKAKLNGCGLIVINPPWMLADQARAMLATLAQALGEPDRASYGVDWLVGE